MTYIIGLTDMSIPMYLLLTGLCRLPSVLISTVGGDALGQNRWVQTIVFFAISAVVSLIGYFIYQIVQKRMASAKKKETDENS